MELKLRPAFEQIYSLRFSQLKINNIKHGWKSEWINKFIMLELQPAF